jgi:SlyX protein
MKGGNIHRPILGSPEPFPVPAPPLVSNTGMNPHDDTAERLTALEIKATFTEDLLEQLDKVIVRQQEQIDLLVREVTALKQQPGPGSPSGGIRNLRDDLPPHF